MVLGRAKYGTPMLIQRSSLLLVSILFLGSNIGADYIPPAKLDGFVYGNQPYNSDTVLVEAFFDPLCPDSSDSWPPLKRALDDYGSGVSSVVHLYPLPYHDNAFVASRALHVVNELNASATFPLLEWFFKYQEKFYGARTQDLSRASIVEEIVKSASEVAGSSYFCSVKSGINDRKSDLQTRVSFKYAALRGVYGTPSFFVNGFLLPDTGAALDYNAWREILDPLVNQKSIKNEESIHFLL